MDKNFQAGIEYQRHMDSNKGSIEREMRRDVEQMRATAQLVKELVLR